MILNNSHDTIQKKLKYQNTRGSKKYASASLISIFGNFLSFNKNKNQFEIAQMHIFTFFQSTIHTKKNRKI